MERPKGHYLFALPKAADVREVQRGAIETRRGASQPTRGNSSRIAITKEKHQRGAGVPHEGGGGNAPHVALGRRVGCDWQTRTGPAGMAPRAKCIVPSCASSKAKKRETDTRTILGRSKEEEELAGIWEPHVQAFGRDPK